jgi:hypothetical protein
VVAFAENHRLSAGEIERQNNFLSLPVLRLAAAAVAVAVAAVPGEP